MENMRKDKEKEALKEDKDKKRALVKRGQTNILKDIFF